MPEKLSEVALLPLEISDISNQIVEKMHLELIPEEIKQSLSHSTWLAVDGGRIVIELRNQAFMRKNGVVNLVDFDDTVLSATKWHRAEQELLVKNLAEFAKEFDFDQAEVKSLYEMSKIFVPSKAEKESRYTPVLNMLLLDHALRMFMKGFPKEQVFESLAKKRLLIEKAIQQLGDDYLFELLKTAHPIILQTFFKNTPDQFVYQDLVEDLLTSQVAEDEVADKTIRSIVTRGTIEGPLGQIHKVHASGVVDGCDFIIYTNDLKEEVIQLVRQLFPELKKLPILIFDDNPKELEACHEMILRLKLKDVELILVRHQDAKRRDFVIRIPADVRITKDNPVQQETIYDHFLAGAQNEVTN